MGSLLLAKVMSIFGGNDIQSVLFCHFLTVVNTFPYSFSQKYFLLFVIPPFHLSMVIIVIIRRLRVVELRVEYGWNYMKFHP